MKYVRWRIWIILLTVTAGVIFLLQYAVRGPGIYRSSSPVTDTLVTETYPDLYGDLYQRDAALLKPYLSHESRRVREQAWRALASTPVDSPGRFIEAAVRQNSDAAWFAVSRHALPGAELRRVEETWFEQPDCRPGIARVMGRQGDRKSLAFLLRETESGNIGEEEEYQAALALSRLIMRYEMDGGEQISLLQAAFEADSEITRAYLYGWYRGGGTSLTATARDTLFGRWQTLGPGTRSRIDQLVARILPARTAYELTIYYNGENLLDSKVQLSVELAQSLSTLELDNRNTLAAKILLTHENPHVRMTTLQSLSGKLTGTGNITRYIRREMIPDSLLDPPVWVRALAVASEVDPSLAESHEERLQRTAGENPYLLPEVLSVYEKTESPGSFTGRIREHVRSEDPRRAMYAVQYLASWWRNRETAAAPNAIADSVREIAFAALEMGDRGVTYAVQPLLREEELFAGDDFPRINRALSPFSLPQDIEVYQAFGSLYRERFAGESRQAVDSLASFNYPPLNRSLAEAGWEVTVPENAAVDFRTPDWNRLWKLGTDPVLRFRTEKGDIFVRVQTLKAPATVSAIDSLSRAGAYDGIPFHRVVPNFVIQGGDVERSDGMGGAEFIIPTEGTEEEFIRGAAGIASAGTDTEGGQYFIMHQWKPHLNGNYTRFGEVIGGMEVVDRITAGDRVLSVTWY